MKQIRRTLMGGVAVLALTAGLLVAGTTSADAAPIDPVDPATLVLVDRPGNKMISAAPFDVSAYGYVEQEFFASGEAHRYLNTSGQPVGTSGTTAVTMGEIAGDYRTRVVTRTPPADKFNGTLVVEWTNQTTGNDGEFTIAESYDSLMNQGFALATISAQRTGVNNIVATRPGRYVGLEVDSEDCSPACPNDAMSWDIVSQVSKALKGSPASPFAGLGVSKVILAGQSGAGASITRYYNVIQPRTEVFDGFVNWDGTGQEERTDLTTPYIRVSSWTKAGVTAAPTRVAGPFNREWEVNGAAHGSKFAHEYFDKVFTRDCTQINCRSFTEWHTAAGNCASPRPGTPVRVGQVLGAAFAAVNTWSRGGPAAAPSTYFQRNPDGTLAENAYGLSIGGVQIADAAVPHMRTARQSGGLFCTYAGQWGEYTPAELRAMYPSHQAYVQQVTDVSNAAVAQGYLLAENAQKTIAEAQASDIGYRGTTTDAVATAPAHEYGTATSVSVQVTSPDAVPSGAVSLQKNGVQVGTGTLNGTGQATVLLAGTALAPGSHTLKVVYLGNGNFYQSSDEVQVTVTKVAVTTTAKAAKTKLRKGQRGKITIAVAPAALLGGGTVTVKEGSKTIVANLGLDMANGRVIVTLPKLKKGKHTFVVTYSGTDQAGASTSNAVTIKSKG